MPSPLTVVVARMIGAASVMGARRRLLDGPRRGYSPRARCAGGIPRAAVSATLCAVPAAVVATLCAVHAAAVVAMLCALPACAASRPDGAAGDAAMQVDAATGGDAPGPLHCGDHIVDPDEVCDGDERSCDDLGATFGVGTAPCRADCLGWDPTTCPLANAGRFEAVKPAERDSKWTTARCNDGTPFSFVVRLASPASDRWVIYLEGGVYCDDESFACSSRDPTLTTTLPFADRSLGPIPFTGLFGTSATANPDFAQANQVIAHYCSSDFWAGATTDRRPSSGGSWYFSGHAAVEALVRILAERYGLDDERPDLQVLFGGGSAGAFGGHFNASRVRAALPRAAAAGRLRLLVDAGWMTDWDDPAHRLGTATVRDRDVWTHARALWGATFDPACEAAHADPVDCFFGPGWYPYVSMPTFIQQCSTDQSFTMVHNLQPTDPAAQAWHTQVDSSLAPVSWLFSGTQPYHMLGIDDSTMSYGPAGHDFARTLHDFWSGTAPERVVF
jgi:Pectinacetylesterase